MPNSLNTAEKTTPAMIPRIIPMAIQMSLERAKFLIFLFFGANAIIRQIIQPIAGRENSKFNPKNAPVVTTAF